MFVKICFLVKREQQTGIIKRQEMKKDFDKVKRSALFLVSSVAFVFFVWMLIFGKIKAAESLSSLFSKLPQNQSELFKTTENVLGTAVEKARGGGAKKAVEQGSKIFESSAIAEPARQMREDVKQKIDQTIEGAKQLPAQELNTVKMQICKEWFGDQLTATPSGR